MVSPKIILITDAWHPQVNGVVTTYANLLSHLPENYSVTVIHPGMFRTLSAPFYPEISLSLCSKKKMKRILQDEGMNDSMIVHIATEGPLGLQAKRVLDRLGKAYTTAYHTKFPEFIEKITGIPLKYTKWYFDWFHKRSKFVMVSSESNRKELGYSHARVLGKGCDRHFAFQDRTRRDVITLLFVGRVSKEKNIEAFCQLELAGHQTRKIVVGDGPEKARLAAKYPKIDFVGYKFGAELASYYQNADVMIFPSKTDTFGLVVLEAMACGTPVAAYPVTGPIDQIIEGINGSTNSDLEIATLQCLSLDRKQVAQTVQDVTWANSARQFVTHLTLT